MADNKTTQSATPATIPASTTIATKEVAFSGQTTDVQLIEIVAVTGSEGSRTLNEISDASGLKIQDGGNTITVDGTVTVTDGSGSLTIDGTVAATQSGAWNVTNVSGTVSLPTGASTLAEQQSQTTHLATIAGDTTDIETAVELIDDTVATLGTTTYSEATTKGLIVGAVRRDADTTLADTTNEIAPLQVDANGRLKVEAFSGETLPVSLTSTTVTGTVAVTQSGTWDEVGINDSGNSITVDNNGTFVTQIDGTALTRLTDIETNTDSGAVVGNGAAATAQRVTLANDSTGIVALTTSSATIGKLAANSGVDIGDVDITSIAAGDNNIGNVDIASIAAGDNNIGNVDIVTLPALAAGTNEIGSLLPPDTDVTAHTNYARKYYTSTGAATDGIVWSPAAGKRWHVVSLYFNVSAAATVTFEDDKAGGDDPVLKGEFAANSGMTINFGEQYPMASGEDAADLLVTTSAGNIYVTVTGYEI